MFYGEVVLRTVQERLSNKSCVEEGRAHEYSCLRSAEASDPTSTGVTDGCKAPVQVRGPKLVSSAAVAFTLSHGAVFPVPGHPFSRL